MLTAVCRDSAGWLGIGLRHMPKSWGTLRAPALYRLADYGLELTDECGTAMGPSDCSSSDRPMHWPELPPVHGMLSTSGSPPGEVSPTSGEFGTRSGRHSPVKVSSDSPPGHAATVGELVGTATTATAGAAAIATANPPARISRRAGSFKVAMVTLSVVLLDRSSREGVLTLSAVCMRSTSSLPMARPKLWRQRPSASRDITLTTSNTLSHRVEKWCVCLISESLLSSACGTASRTLAVAP